MRKPCECEYEPITPPNCDDNDCNTIDNYNTETCECEYKQIAPPNCDDDDCTTEDSYDSENCICVHEPLPPPSCEASSEGQLDCSVSSSVTLLGNSDGVDVLYSWKGISPPFNDDFESTEQNPSTSQHGFYELTVTDQNGCLTSSCTTEIDLPFCDPLIIEIPKDILVPCDIEIPDLLEPKVNSDLYPDMTIGFTDSIGDFIDSCNHIVYRKYCATATVNGSIIEECETQIITIIPPLGLRTSGDIMSLEAYPNPTSSKVTVRVTLARETDLDVVISDHLGRVVDSHSVPAEKKEISIEFENFDLGAGTYYISAKTATDIKSFKANLVIR